MNILEWKYLWSRELQKMLFNVVGDRTFIVRNYFLRGSSWVEKKVEILVRLQDRQNERV